MSGLGGIIHWGKQPVPTYQIRHMMEMVKHRGPDGLWAESSENIGLGFALLAMKKSDSLQPQPLWLPDNSCAIVADTSIYNRDQLLRWLGAVPWWKGEPSDAAILLAAYERWGVDILDFLDGDFAFAIWDSKRERLFAARDPFSAKPFFYYHDSLRFLFGSEPKQLLTQPAMTVEPDDDAIGEFLLRRFSRLEKTFFKDIWRLKPAHYLIVTRDKVLQKRWWEPDPRKEIWYENPQDYYDQFRELLKAAVAKRLNTDFPVIAELSGGFDSSSIVVLAEEIYHQNSRSLPLLETLSYVFPHEPTCDETAYIRAVLERVAFISNGFSVPNRAFTVDELDEEIWRQDAPFTATTPAMSAQLARISYKNKVRTMLSGVGGDELALLNYDLRDLVRHGKFFTLIQDVSLFTNGSVIELARNIYWATGSALPESIKRLTRSLRRANNTHLPGCLTPEFAAFLRQRVPEAESKSLGYRSAQQNVIKHEFNSPDFHLDLECFEVQSSWGGYETRYPYCDRMLVEFVLAMPIEARFKGERWRYLQRQGLADQLPPIIKQRKDKTHLFPYYSRVLREAISEMEQYLFSGKWHSAPYISRDSAESLFRSSSLLNGEYSSEPIYLIWDVATLESWLRGFNRYVEMPRLRNDIF